jgi:hypothetical protein
MEQIKTKRALPDQEHSKDCLFAALFFRNIFSGFIMLCGLVITILLVSCEESGDENKKCSNKYVTEDNNIISNDTNIFNLTRDAYGRTNAQYDYDFFHVCVSEPVQTSIRVHLMDEPGINVTAYIWWKKSVPFKYVIEKTGAGANRILWFSGGDYSLQPDFIDQEGSFTQQVNISFPSRASRALDWVYLFDSLHVNIDLTNKFYEY